MRARFDENLSRRMRVPVSPAFDRRSLVPPRMLLFVQVRVPPGPRAHINQGVFPSFSSQGAKMAFLVMQVAVSGELVEVFEMPVDEVDGHRMLACANEDERVILRAGQILEDGEVWIDLIDTDGETLFDQVACFHRADAADALQVHFDMNAEVVKDCLSKSNVASLYAKHRVAAQAYFRKVDRLVDCSMVSSRQSNRRRVGDATVMDLVVELCRRLDGADTLLALK
jgi:hypothetical protein